MEKLYKFHWNVGRLGNLHGLFIADEKEIENLIGKEANFGEALGKHSEIRGCIDRADLKEIEVSEITIREMQQVVGRTISGFNPLDYVGTECPCCGISYEQDEMDWFEDEYGNYICENCNNKYNK